MRREMESEGDDPFDAILFPEDKFCEEGYKAGAEKGMKDGLAEGFATGWQQGCKLGEEVGFYRGFAEGWLDNLASSSSKLHLDDRKLKLVHVSLSQLRKMAGTFEIVGIKKDNFATELTKIRSKFKQNGQDGKYFKFHDEISTKSSTTSVLPSGHLPLTIVENGIHKQVDKTESVNSETSFFIKRRPSEMLDQNEHSPISPTRNSLRRGSAWSSEPVLTLNVPQVAINQQLPTQNQLRNQYDAFEDGVLLSKIIAGQLGHPELTGDEKKVLRSKKFQLWRALCYFFTITSFHGLPHIAGTRSCIRICYWMFLICIALGLMVWAIVSISIAYFEFNTYIKTELEEPGQLKFPAVTICNLNQYRRTYLERALGYDETQIFIGALFIDALSSRRILTRDFDFSEINTTISELAEMYTDDFQGTAYYDSSHQLENMLVSCYFNNEPCFKGNFTSGLNINGRCFTFNTNASDFLNVTSPGALYGLELVLNVEQYEYFLPDINSVGFKVYLHQQGDFPYLGEHRGFTISPGMHTDVVVSIEQLEYLEPPYGVCHKDLQLEYFPIYTREACLDECRTKGMVRTCGCRFFYMPGNATICNVNEFANCAGSYLQTFWEQNECDCPLPCNTESYKYELSYSAYPGRHFPLLLYRAGVLANTPGIPESIRQLNATNNVTAQNEIFDFFKDNIVKTTLYYNQLSLLKLTEVTEYDTFQFIADFGGHLGLFTGAGFLTLFEFVELCLGIFYPRTIDKDHHTI